MTPDPAPHPTPKEKSTARLLWVLFSLFVVYGTTIPFRFGLGPGGFGALFARIIWDPRGPGGDVSLPDIVQNILLFIPFGFLGFIALADKRSHLGLKLLTLVLMGAGLSAFVEFLQLFTPTRFTALSDVIWNTLGTALGVYAGVRLKQAVLDIKRHPLIRRWLEAPSAFPALVFAALAVAGSWEPFNFALEVHLMWGKAKVILADPFDITLPNDELAAFIRFLLAALFAARLAEEAGLRRPAAATLAFYVLAALGLETTQLIIGSRAPSFQDALVSVLGVLAGTVAFGFPGFHRHPWAWGALGAAAVTASAALAGLHPFRVEAYHAGFNWLPFMSEYVNTTLDALGNFLESTMTFFPLGFLLSYFFPGRRGAAWAALSLTLLLSFGVELAQGYIVGRYSDITDVIGAMAGCLAGILVHARGWSAYREYTK